MCRKVLLWDFDGTLGYRRNGMWSAAIRDAILDMEPGSAVAVQDIRQHLQRGFPWHQPEVAHPELNEPDVWWANLKESVLIRACMSLGFSRHQARELAEIARAKYVDASRWALFDDVLPALPMLSESGWHHLIVSNHVPELETIVASLGLRPHIEDIVNSSRIGYEKPHPEIYHIAFERAGRPEVVWMVGDDVEADVLGAERAGVPGILVRRTDPRARHWCPDLSGIARLLEDAGSSDLCGRTREANPSPGA